MSKMIQYLSFIIGITILSVPIYIHFRKARNNEEADTVRADGTENSLNIIQLKESLDMNNMWIGNCDQKASILLAVIGVVSTVVMTSDAIKTIRNYIVLPFLKYINGDETMCFSFSRFSVFVFLIFTSVFAIFSVWHILNSIKPNLDYNAMKTNNPQLASKSFIFYGSVANMSYEEFKNTPFDYENDLRSQVYTNAKIANLKFNNYLKGFFWFKMMILSAVMLSVTVMFMK